MDQLVAHERAQQAFARVLAGVKPDQLDGPTPCPEWNVWAVIDHVVGGNWRVAGTEEPTPGSAEDLAAAHAASALAAQSAFSADDGLTRTYHIRIGDVPGSAYVGLRTTDTLVHAWDIATATGQPTDLDPEVAEAMLDMSRQRITDAFRGEGRPFGTEQECGDDHSIADRLAAFLGRRP